MSTSKPRGKFPLYLLYVGFVLAILGLLIWSFLRTLQENDTRQASVELPGQGFVTVSLTTDPYFKSGSNRPNKTTEGAML